MTLTSEAKRSLMLGTLLLALGVLIGAFGAHGLKSMVDEAKLVTFETGVRYHFYHAFGLVLFGLFQAHTKSQSKLTTLFFVLGILLFSFNCYLYAVSGIKTFAMIVPVGGLSYMAGWICFFREVMKTK